VTARVTDWGLAALVAALVASGGLTLFAGSSSDAWVFAAHDVLGVVIGLLLVVKLRRVWSRVANAARWDERTIVGVVGVAAVVATIGSGLLWSVGWTPDVAGYSLLSVHDALGVVLAIVVAVHMALRAKPLRGRDLAHRRQFLAGGGAVAASLVAWRSSGRWRRCWACAARSGGSPGPTMLGRSPAMPSRQLRGSRIIPVRWMSVHTGYGSRGSS
jgi:hypothetical protein